MARELKKLSHRHKLFCQYYVQSFNASESAVKAGFPESNKRNTSCLLLQTPIIKGYIANLLKQNEISDDELKGKIQRFIDVADSDTNKLRAAELMARVKGIVKTGDTNVAVSVGSEGKLSDIMSRRFGGLVENEAGQ